MFRIVLTKISLASLALILSTSSYVLAMDRDDDDKDSRKNSSSYSSVPTSFCASSSSRGGATVDDSSSALGSYPAEEKPIFRVGKPITPEMFLGVADHNTLLRLHTYSTRALAENDKTFSLSFQINQEEEMNPEGEKMVFRPIRQDEIREDMHVVPFSFKGNPTIYLRVSRE